MSDSDYLAERFPALACRLGKLQLASLPTPVGRREIRLGGTATELLIKYDNLTSPLYGGNKVRKLEYLLRPATRRPIRRFATFGTVGSHHALATALFARHRGFECTCFLAHQRATNAVPATLNMLLRNNAEIVRYGGAYHERLQILRRHLWQRDAWIVPAGGSSWYGTLGFVNAGLELASQIAAGDVPLPDRVYVATGTMGTAAGLALGFAMAELPVAVHAVRVSHDNIASEQALHRLIDKTVSMMHRLDRSVPQDLARRVKIILRHEFFAGGYAHSNDDIEAALHLAREQLDLELEATYTGKALAALLSDAASGAKDSGTLLYWNTVNSVPLNTASDRPPDNTRLPPEFLRYFS